MTSDVARTKNRPHQVWRTVSNVCPDALAVSQNRTSDTLAGWYPGGWIRPPRETREREEAALNRVELFTRGRNLAR